MRLFNTLTRKVEEFKPQRSWEVKIYCCGPTVYDFAHIGHSRTYINNDVLIRSLKWLGYRVKSVMNITDVGHLTSDSDTGEDKMEKKAKAEKKDIVEIAKFYTDDFWEMCRQLNIGRPDLITPATKYIQEMIKLIKVLEQKGLVYKTSDGVYFDTSKVKNYGELGRVDIEGLRAGWRVDKGEKKNPTDFALWKFSPKTEKRQMEWQSPWGIGFPGWHIECSAMSLKHLGPTLDIHCGGVDHIQVHHTNEICQSEAATGKKFANYWFHSNHLTVNGEKMSKSLKNFIRVKDLIAKGYDPLTLRYLFLTSHYRTKMNFTYQALEAAKEAYGKLQSMVWSCREDRARTNLSAEKLAKVQELGQRFKAAVEEDLAMPQAIAIVWETMKSNAPSEDKWELIRDWDQVLGLNLGQARKPALPEEIKNLMSLRQKLRQEKRWEEADKIREEIEKQGYQVQDKRI